MGKSASRKKRPIKAKARKSSLGFTIVVVAIVVLGVAGIALSRGGGGGSTDNTPPTLNDHWHTAYAVNLCGVVQPNMQQPDRLLGLHTHSDGLIHIEPFVTASILDRGNNATLARFVEGEPGMKLTSSEVQLPGGKLMKNGDKCGDKPGKVTIRQWKNATGNQYTDYTNPKDVKITDGGALTIAFVPEGGEIAKPSTIPNLANPNAGEGGAPKMPQS
jgi:hypothetical protein